MKQGVELGSYLKYGITNATEARVIVEFLQKGYRLEDLAKLVEFGYKPSGMIYWGIKSAEIATKAVEAITESISKVKSVADDFLNYVDGCIVKLQDGFAFRPSFAGIGDIGDDSFYFIKGLDINDINKLEEIAQSSNKLLDEGCETANNLNPILTITERIREYDSIKNITSLSKTYPVDMDHSKILKAELYANNITPPNHGFATHHIVAWNAPEAALSRNILEKYGIDIDSAANGVFLPFERNGYVTTEAMHSGGHLAEYYKTVEDRLIKIDDFIKAKNLNEIESRLFICQELNNIRKDLLNGVLKIHN